MTERAISIPKTTDGLIRQIDNRLCAIRGYCELAKLKGESGDALARRMDAAVDTLVELSDMIQELRSRCPPPNNLK